MAADWFADGDHGRSAAAAAVAALFCFDAVGSYRRSLAGEDEQETS